MNLNLKVLSSESSASSDDDDDDDDENVENSDVSTCGRNGFEVINDEETDICFEFDLYGKLNSRKNFYI